MSPQAGVHIIIIDRQTDMFEKIDTGVILDLVTIRDACRSRVYPANGTGVKKACWRKTINGPSQLANEPR